MSTPPLATRGGPGAALAVAPLLPGEVTLGMLGGGQLGRMFVHAAQAAGFRVAVLDPDPASPAGAAADLHLCAGYEDAAALDELAQRCAAVSTEFENVPAAALRRLAGSGCCVVAPPADAVEICQHRAREKAAFVAAGVPCTPHARVGQTADGAAHGAAGGAAQGAAGEAEPGADAAADAGAYPGADPAVDLGAGLEDGALDALLPGILKTATLGYDGKGQVAVPDRAALATAWASLGRVPCVLERRLPLACELSVIVARGRDGAWVHLPVQQNRHRDGILAVTEVPAPDVAPGVAAAAVAHAARLAEALGYVGVLCVEFFLLADGTLVANEMAPRPHNSGHYSIDACDVSQFDLQVRTLAGLPLAAPRQHSAAVMLNLLGDLWFAGGGDAPRTPDWPAVLALPGAHLYLYGKVEARRGRKMGHLTLTAPDTMGARATARLAAARLGLPSLAAT
jgi:5-(carboxyamino)imidazole ribonucleotide synthase